MKFKVGDVIKCKGEHFTEREILNTSDRHKYVTKFLEDNSIVTDDVGIIDSVYWLVEK